MYKVLMDGLTLYDPLIPDYELFNTALNLEVNKTGFFEFTIYPKHPLYDRIKQLKSIVTVYQKDKIVFEGRVLDTERIMNKALKVSCEGVLGFLNDSVLPPYNFNGTVKEYLQMFIDNYNEVNKPELEFVLGEVDVVNTTTTEALIRSSIDYTNAYTELSSKTFNSSLGGYMSAKIRNGKIELNYLKDSKTKSNQVVKLGVNMLDLVESNLTQSLITGIIPVGAKLEDENGEETDERLTIEAINDGKAYLLNEDAAEKYGIIMTTQVWDDITLPENLIKRGQTELINRSSLIRSLEINAVDLALIDVDTDAIDVMDYIRVISEPHKINEMAMITSREIDITNASDNSFTFGFNYKSLTSDQVETGKKVEKIESDYVPNEKLSEVRDDLTTLNSKIDQTAENVRIEVSQEFVSNGSFDEYREFVSTEFEQSAKGWDFMFKELEEYVQGLDDGMQNEFAEIIKYIRFINGTIVLGEVGNPMTVEISNNRVSFKQNGMEVAYISDNILYITDGYFTNSLRVGNFMFRPRKNGSLSFGKVGM